MDFRVGDQVIHWTLGLGEVIGVEERALSGENMLYYMVKIRDLTVFVPAEDKTACRLRSPSTKRDFKKLFEILGEPGIELADNRFERKADGSPESVCRVIRDLSLLARTKHLNDDDKNILERAMNSLRSEMVLALSILPDQADSELHQLLMQPEAVAI
jgi:RNA polymerase-interacting CarD/CdnL/TRCF family regulator